MVSVRRCPGPGLAKKGHVLEGCLSTLQDRDTPGRNRHAEQQTPSAGANHAPRISVSGPPRSRTPPARPSHHFRIRTPGRLALRPGKEHCFFHLVPVDRCRCTGRDGDITRGQRARSGIPAYDRSAQHAWRYFAQTPQPLTCRCRQRPRWLLHRVFTPFGQRPSLGEADGPWPASRPWPRWTLACLATRRLGVPSREGGPGCHFGGAQGFGSAGIACFEDLARAPGDRVQVLSASAGNAR